MLTASNGGFIETGIVHAKVIMSALPVLSVQVRSTVSFGCNKRDAVDGLIWVVFFSSDMPFAPKFLRRNLEFSF
jgi:hypothetical protein